MVEQDAGEQSGVNRAVDWCFRSRTTGDIVIGQFPNLSLGVFLVATIVRWIAGPDGNVARYAGWTATAALLIWAIDEIIRGVNPWRRALGAGVVIAQVVGFLVR